VRFIINVNSHTIKNPEKYAEQRRYWHQKTMYKPDGNSSERIIDTIIQYSKMKNPFLLLLHGNNEVLKTHLNPLFGTTVQLNIESDYIAFFNKSSYLNKENLICLSATIDTHGQAHGT